MEVGDLDNFIAACGSARPDDAELGRFVSRSGLSPALFCDEVARRVVEQFLSGAINFEIGDATMNRIWEFGFLNPEEPFLSDLAKEVFSAFDEGEYHHSEDDRSVDPGETYTRPHLLALASQIRL